MQLQNAQDFLTMGGFIGTLPRLLAFAGVVQSTIRTLGPAPPAAPNSFSRAYPPVLVQLVASSSVFVFLGSHHLSTDLHNEALPGLCRIGIYVKADDFAEEIHQAGRAILSLLNWNNAELTTACCVPC